MLNSKQKGARGEREVRDLLKSFGWEARRGQQFSGCPDAPDVISNFGWHIEAKHVERLNIFKAIEQAMRDCGEKRPCVFFKKNRSEWWIAFPAKEILKELNGH